MPRLPLFLLLAALPLAAVDLTPGVPVYVAPGEPESVRRAARDLQRDLKNVLGADSPLIDSLDAARTRPAILVSGPGSPSAPFRRASLTGREAHAVFLHNNDVVLQGADARGAIYAIYTFSERFLGVPPLWFWTSFQPQPRPSISIPARTSLVFDPPYVRWRAWFPNDEDLLTPWRARSQENYEAFLETMLRLKLNTLEGGLMDFRSFDTPYSIGRQARLASDRGLALTGHHMLIFGSSYANWGAFWRKIRHTEPPALTVANVAALEDFWKYHIDAGLKHNIEMVWLIGFRGDRDIPFWETFPDAPKSDPERARIIQDMMTRQVALLRQATGGKMPPMRVTLYNENSDFFAQGLLRPPDEPSLIWAFVAARRDHYPAPDVLGFRNDSLRPVGYYMNFQFTSSGAHLAQAEGPWKMERNFRMVNEISRRPLEFSVVNAGNIREFLLELSANADMMWNFNQFRADSFLLRFCQQYFGSQHAARAAALYRDLFHSYWIPKKSDIPGFDRQYVFQDMRYARALELILAQLPKGPNPNPLTDKGMDAGGRYFRVVPADNGVTTQLEAIEKGTAASIAKLTRLAAQADALHQQLPAHTRPFFNDNLRVQARFLLHLNQTLQSAARALGALPDHARSQAALAQAELSAAAMQSTLAEAEHDRFTGWYNGDRLFGLAKLRAALARAAKSNTP